MNITWLYGLDHLPPNGSPEWERQYRAWIHKTKKDFPLHKANPDFPLFQINGCYSCRLVSEATVNSGVCGHCGRGSCLYAIFGAHEREAVEKAATEWQERQRK